MSDLTPRFKKFMQMQKQSRTLCHTLKRKEF